MSVTAPLTDLLEQHFGYSTFRPMQEDIIRTVLSGRDCLGIMPTGGGKSLCFQLPALCFEGITVVISPLIALMKDQVDSLNADGIPAAFLNSTQSAREQQEITEWVREGHLKLLYLAPERLNVPGFLSFLQSIDVSLIAIDEAHCISEWGHEFRADYRQLRRLRDALPDVPCIALTATATPKVREDIRHQLRLGEAPVFISTFNRTNLTYHVYSKARHFERLLMVLRDAQRLPAIIYCFSRKDTEALAQELSAEGFACLPYHAGLDQRIRKETQEKFMRDEVRIITATIAFGMGIDKPDVRTVIHMDLPKTIEGYYQETGRAGRDGLPSDCILFYSHTDTYKHEYFIRQMDNPEQQLMTRQRLEHVVKYGELSSCRRSYLLSYFEETYPDPNCQGCDRCLMSQETFDAKDITLQILETVQQTGQRFGAGHICDVLMGKQVAKVVAMGHQHLAVFGAGKSFGEKPLKEIIHQVQMQGFLQKATGLYPTLSVSTKGQDFLIAPYALMLRKPEEQLRIAKHVQSDDLLTFHAGLFEELRTLRRSIADAQKVAAFIVFGDRSLREMAAYVPLSPESFGNIYGVSDRKKELYAERFLAVIREVAARERLTEHAIPDTAGSRKRTRNAQKTLTS